MTLLISYAKIIFDRLFYQSSQINQLNNVAFKYYVEDIGTNVYNNLGVNVDILNDYDCFDFFNNGVTCKQASKYIINDYLNRNKFIEHLVKYSY
jgi:hypothetical protein